MTPSDRESLRRAKALEKLKVDMQEAIDSSEMTLDEIYITLEHVAKKHCQWIKEMN